MKKTILFLSFFALISNVSAKNINDSNIESLDETIESKSIACQHEYFVTSIGCDGFKSKQLMGAGTGDCGSSPENSVIRHNTDVNVCDEETRDTFLQNVAQIAVAIIRAL